MGGGSWNLCIVPGSNFSALFFHLYQVWSSQGSVVPESAIQMVSLDQSIYRTTLAMAAVSNTCCLGLSSGPDLISVTKSEPNSENIFQLYSFSGRCLES